MSEIDEKVARAIHAAWYNAGRQIAPGFPGDYLADGNRFSDASLAHQRLLAQARAAITAYEAAKPAPALSGEMVEQIAAVEAVFAEVKAIRSRGSS